VGKGVIELGSNFEYQLSSEGHEVALPLAVEYGFTDRLEFLIEPVAYTAIRPKVGPRATGGGDLEATLTYLVRRETPGIPAIALAGEVKLPTTRNKLIGTGKTDFAGYLIGSKRFGRLDTHADFGYSVVGQPGGMRLKNIFNFAVGWELGMGRASVLYGEVLANTASRRRRRSRWGARARCDHAGSTLRRDRWFGGDRATYRPVCTSFVRSECRQ
jgi:hypothetical protein